MPPYKDLEALIADLVAWHGGRGKVGISKLLGSRKPILTFGRAIQLNRGRGRRARQVCRYFSTTAGCRFGDTCKFPHEGPSASDGGSRNEHQPAHDEKSRAVTDGKGDVTVFFREWRYCIPKPSSQTGFLRRAPRFFQDALKLVDGDTSTMQETILSLASDGGLQRIRELTNQCSNSDSERRKAAFSSGILPFFQTITHPNVLMSTMLETPLGTIYNYLYGLQGERVLGLFKFINELLVATEDPDLFSCGNMETIIAVLANITDRNTHALVNEGLHSVVDILGDLILSLDENQAHQARKLLNRVSRRLGMGRNLPEAQFKKVEHGFKASFVLQQDLPGELSKEGPRHDNDHASIRDIQILPTYGEIQSSRREYLPSKSPSQLHLPGIEGLLDRHFRLLREDTVGQLREAIRAEFEDMKQGSVTGPPTGQRKFIYQSLAVIDLYFSKWRGLEIAVSFDQPTPIRSWSVEKRRDWWENSKRLQTDALVCILGVHRSVVFCTVAEQRLASTSIKEQQNGNIALLPQSADQPRPKPDNLFTDPQHSYLTLRLVDSDDSNISHILERLTTCHATESKLIEFPGVILPSFDPVLRALQRMIHSQDVPFADYLAPEETDKRGVSIVSPPLYAIKPGFHFDLSSIMKKSERFVFAINDQTAKDGFRRGSQLDEAQADALIRSLSRSLALIQGPPGTGKSFTGVALIKVLLAVKDRADLGPILCVCYTNHALDQLLEHLVHHNVPQIVRIGSRSKSDVLQDCNLRILSKKVDMTKTEKHRRWELATKLNEDEVEIQSLVKTLSSPEHWKNMKSYLEANHPEHYDQLFSTDEDEDGFQTVNYKEENNIQRWLREGIRGTHPRNIGILLDSSLFTTTRTERQQLYRYWVTDLKETVQQKLLTALESYKHNKDEFDRIRRDIDLRCLQQANIIGVTTTGMARQLDLLRYLKAKVLICEEAGEVLEAHILTAFLPSLEHVVLIGDHLQLPPHIQNYELSRENPSGERYSLDVSLFERLVTPTDFSQPGMPYSTLLTQRRMHPQISELVRTTLYPDLKNSPVVDAYPEVSGMKKRLFWLDHSSLETESGTEHIISTSHSNIYEIEIVKALVSHLHRQGVYQTNEIAVLTPYLGQLLLIRKALSKQYEVTMTEGDLCDLEQQGLDDPDGAAAAPVMLQTAKTTLLKALKISTIDNFQGEEAKVVVISLVRSNKQNKCGFLRTSNRINVLLSRAQHGIAQVTLALISNSNVLAIQTPRSLFRSRMTSRNFRRRAAAISAVTGDFRVVMPASRSATQRFFTMPSSVLKIVLDLSVAVNMRALSGVESRA
ncbi:MAG: hypothetical protein M1816_005921 [Peltula sp. TS41687]|nr:MAG: hypothetical protein M1816_005921 [Peltula sp. TS41687]